MILRLPKKIFSVLKRNTSGLRADFPFTCAQVSLGFDWLAITRCQMFWQAYITVSSSRSTFCFTEACSTHHSAKDLIYAWWNTNSLFHHIQHFLNATYTSRWIELGAFTITTSNPTRFLLVREQENSGIWVACGLHWRTCSENLL